MSRKLNMTLATELGYEVQVKHRGYDVVYLTPGKVWSEECPTCSYDGLWVPEGVPWFHSDANAMLWLDREMRERGWDLTVWREGDIWYAVYERTDKDWKSADDYVSIGIKAVTMPLAVALAAYKALTGKE